MKPRTLVPTALEWGSRLGADMVPRCQVASFHFSTVSTHSHGVLVKNAFTTCNVMRDMLVGRAVTTDASMLLKRVS